MSVNHLKYKSIDNRKKRNEREKQSIAPDCWINPKNKDIHRDLQDNKSWKKIGS